MKYINPNLVNQINYRQTGIGGLSAYIDAIIHTILDTHSGLKATKEYWLYYFIKEDYNANVLSLQGVDIDADIFGFPMINRNLRHMVESVTDLFNLVHDEEYIEVMKYCAKRSNNVKNTRYREYMYNKSFSIKSKIEIAKEIDSQSFAEYYDIVKEGNKYVHPNVFIDIKSKQENHVLELEKLLLKNLELFLVGVELFRDKYSPGIQLNCPNCPNYLHDCSGCYEKEKSKVREMISNNLVYTPALYNNGYYW